MIRIDPSHWTADFRIARALAEAYSAAGLPDALFVCVSDPDDDVAGFLGRMVADETRKYYPHVMGTSDAPVTRENFRERAAEALDRYGDAFIVGIEAGYGRAPHLGSVEITDRPLSTLAGISEALTFGDVTVSAVLRLATGEAPARPGAPARRGAKGIAEAAREVGADDALPGRKQFRPLLPEQINPAVVRRIADVIIDGNLRFLSKIGKQEL